MDAIWPFKLILIGLEHNASLLLLGQFDQGRILFILIVSANMTLELLYQDRMCTRGTEPRVLIKATHLQFDDIVNALNVDIMDLVDVLYH